jgi:hypothetical protein
MKGKVVDSSGIYNSNVKDFFELWRCSNYEKSYVFHIYGKFVV